MRQQSAVLAVPKSGFDLVPHRRAKPGKIATPEQIAKIDFKPWTRDPSLGETGLFPPNDTLLKCGVPARMAYGVMLRTKEQLVEMHGEIEHEHVDTMMAEFCQCAETLKAIANMVEAAYLRVLSSASLHNLKKGKFKGVHDMRRKARKRRRA